MDLKEANKQLGEMMGEEFTLYAGFLDEIIAHLALDPSSKILDVGTGWGVMPLVLALNGYDVLTGEPERTTEKYPDRDAHESHRRGHKEFSVDWRNSARVVGVESKIKFQHLDAEQLLFADSSFDALFMNGTLHILQKKRVALEESLRVIKPNGVVTIIEGNEKAQNRENHATVYATVDPRDFLQRNDVSIEVITGDLAIAYILKKTTRSGQ